MTARDGLNTMGARSARRNSAFAMCNATLASPFQDLEVLCWMRNISPAMRLPHERDSRFEEHAGIVSFRRKPRAHGNVDRIVPRLRNAEGYAWPLTSRTAASQSWLTRRQCALINGDERIREQGIPDRCGPVRDRLPTRGVAQHTRIEAHVAVRGAFLPISDRCPQYHHVRCLARCGCMTGYGEYDDTRVEPEAHPPYG